MNFSKKHYIKLKKQITEELSVGKVGTACDKSLKFTVTTNLVQYILKKSSTSIMTKYLHEAVYLRTSIYSELHFYRAPK